STLAVSALLVSHSSYTPDSDRWDQQLPARRCRRSVAPPQWRVRTAPALRLASFVRITPAVTGRSERMRATRIGQLRDIDGMSTTAPARPLDERRAPAWLSV